MCVGPIHISTLVVKELYMCVTLVADFLALTILIHYFQLNLQIYDFCVGGMQKPWHPYNCAL